MIFLSLSVGQVFRANKITKVLLFTHLREIPIKFLILICTMFNRRNPTLVYGQIIKLDEEFSAIAGILCGKLFYNE